MTAPDPIREALKAAASSLRRPWPSFPTRALTILRRGDQYR